MEEWRDIKGYEGLYQVSNEGRVINSRRGKLRKTTDNGCGYYYVLLSKNGVKKPYYVHRLVAEVFIPNPDNLPQVNHKDEDKTRNVVENLEWCSSRYNMNYGTARDRTSEKQRKKVYQYTKDNVLVKVWDGVNLTREYGFDTSSVSCCCNGIQKTHKGYKWSFEPL